MIESKIFNPPISMIAPNMPDGRLEMSRLLAAAAINTEFCRQLLADPISALRHGFQGEDFSFTEEERDLILSIRARSLAELASELARTFNEHLHLGIKHTVQPIGVFGS
jgi:hypothetical protein